MIKQFSIYLLIVAAFIGCKPNNNATRSNSDKTKSQKNLPTYLALGDSYTIGEQVETEQSFPFQLVNELRNRGINFSSPKIIAKTGWRTDELLAASKDIESNSYDLVSLLIGVNNQYQGKSITDFSTEFELLLENAINYSKKDAKGVFVLSIPDYGVTPFMRGKDVDKVQGEIKMFNAAIKTISEKHDVQVYDVTEISRMAKKDVSLIANDKLHPSAKMYNIWIMKNVDSIIANNL